MSTIFCHDLQIRSLEALHKLFEQFPGAFMNNLHVPLPNRLSLFVICLFPLNKCWYSSLWTNMCVCVSVALFCFVSEYNVSFAGLVALLPARWAIHQNYPLPPKNAFVNSLQGRNCINLYYRIINFFFL